MSGAIDLSCDLGEALTIEEKGTERSIWPLISSANVACGGHVGDEASMRDAIERCLEHGVILGAHPSYPDRKGFGRRPMEISDDDLLDALSSQISLLRELADRKGVVLERIKPHGALYSQAHHDTRLGAIIVRVVQSVVPSASIVCAAGSQISEIAAAKGQTVVREAFADRRYRPDGALVSRSESNALLLDANDAAKQALSLAEEGRVIASDGSPVALDFETLCIHSDMEGSVNRLERIRAELERAGFEIRSSRR